MGVVAILPIVLRYRDREELWQIKVEKVKNFLLGFAVIGFVLAWGAVAF